VPELPEVETLRRQLASELVGRRLLGVEVSGRRTVRRQPVEEFVGRITGRRVAAIDRRGKFLLVRLAPGGDLLVVHLRMSGRLLLARRGDRRPPHTHAVFALGHGRELRFVDPRTFGELYVGAAESPGLGRLGLGRLGPDVLDELVSAEDLAAVLARRRARLKTVLMDQRRMAGLGNIYSDEVLFAARLRGDRAAGSLSAREIRRLHAAIRQTLEAAIGARGSSLPDESYTDANGEPGGFQRSHRVYGREGLPCLCCGRPIRRRRVGGRSHYFCGRCQR